MVEWLTLAEIKAYLKITDTSYDADITFQLTDFKAQTRVARYINRGLDYVLPIDFHQTFAKYVLFLVSEMGVDSGNGRVVKSWSFDGESKTYEDAKGNSKNVVALSSFSPLKRSWT